MQDIEQSILRRIRGGGRGWCFTAADFADLGGTSAVWTALHRLMRRGAIRRLARGLYDLPRTHPVLGTISADADAAALAVARSRHIRIQPTGSHAANLLGISNQVPARIVFLTDGTPRRIRIGNREIVLRRTTPRNMETAGRISGTVIQALRYIGKDRLTPAHVAKLRRTLSAADKRLLFKDRVYAPGWMRPLFAELGGKIQDHA